MTFNIHHGVGTDGRLDLTRTADVVRAHSPDLVGLQEVDRRFGDRSGRADQASWLARTLRMTARYGPAMTRGDSEYGNALLTGRAVSGWEWGPLPTPPDAETRAVLRSRTSGLNVWVTHLSTESPQARVAQAEAIVARLGSQPAPTILVGDFNAGPEDDCLAVLGSRFADVWTAVGAGPGWTFSTTRPRLRIDYVMVTPDVTPVSVDVVDAGVSSDHHAVLAELRVP